MTTTTTRMTSLGPCHRSRRPSSRVPARRCPPTPRRFPRPRRALESRTEKFVESLERESEELLAASRARERETSEKERELEELRRGIDALYLDTFDREDLKLVADVRSAADFKRLGREDPSAFEEVMGKLQESEAWKELQERSHAMRLREMEIAERLRQIRSEAEAEDRERALALEEAEAWRDALLCALAAGFTRGDA